MYKVIVIIIAVLALTVPATAGTLTINIPVDKETDLANAMDAQYAGRCPAEAPGGEPGPCLMTKAEWVEHQVKRFLKSVYISHQNKIAREAALDALTPVTEDALDLDQ